MLSGAISKYSVCVSVVRDPNPWFTFCVTFSDLVYLGISTLFCVFVVIDNHIVSTPKTHVLSDAWLASHLVTQFLFIELHALTFVC